ESGATKPMRSARGGADLVVAEEPLPALAGLEHPRDALVGRLDPEALEAVDDVRLAAHRTDADALLQADHARGHAAVDRVGERDVALAERLDHRGGVHARAGLERVVAEHRVVVRDLDSDGFGD